jgi:hypothetical protein
MNTDGVEFQSALIFHTPSTLETYTLTSLKGQECKDWNKTVTKIKVNTNWSGGRQSEYISCCVERLGKIINSFSHTGI